MLDAERWSWMKLFKYKAVYEKLLVPEIVRDLSQIHEHKGQQKLFVEIHKKELDELLDIAKIQSTEASNRIEGIITADDRLKSLVRNKTTPRNRNEREIAGYRDVLATIYEEYEYIPIRPNPVLQMHRDLYKYSNASAGGRFKNTDNVIDQELPEGTKRVCFEPVSAWEAPEAMEELCRAYNDALIDPEMDPLLLIPMFILDFLCIQPFNDGNGRMSRLLMLLLLYRAGYTVGKYISLEKLISDSRESYYEALQDSSAGWHEGKNDYLPFVRYMLSIILTAYRDFDARVEVLITRGLSKPGRVREIIRSTTGSITKSEIMVQCPDISQKTVERALKDLMDSQQIIKIGGGRYTSYTWDWKGEHT